MPILCRPYHAELDSLVRPTAEEHVATERKISAAAVKKTASVTKPATKSESTAAAKKAAAAKSAETVPAKAVVKAPAKSAAKAPAKVPAKSAAKAAPTKRTSTSVAAPPKTALSTADLREIKKQIEGELRKLRAEYEQTLASLDELQRQATDTAGDDQADTGSKTFEREQEMSIAANRLDLITQMEHAIHRIDNKTYGMCENCGKPIPKARLQAFPSATLCVTCKTREERR